MKKYISFLFAFLLSSCQSVAGLIGPTPTLTAEPCAVQALEFIIEAQDLLQRWDDAYKIAQSTSRIALGTAVASLQEVRRELNNLPAPECASSTKSSLVDFMDDAIDGFLSFMADESESVVSSHFSRANVHLEQGMKWLLELQLALTPSPTPLPGKTLTSIAKTLNAIPTDTPMPPSNTPTPWPTNTPKPTDTPTLTPTRTSRIPTPTPTLTPIPLLRMATLTRVDLDLLQPGIFGNKVLEETGDGKYQRTFHGKSGIQGLIIQVFLNASDSDSRIFNKKIRNSTLEQGQPIELPGGVKLPEDTWITDVDPLSIAMGYSFEDLNVLIVQNKGLFTSLDESVDFLLRVADAQYNRMYIRSLQSQN